MNAYLHPSSLQGCQYPQFLQILADIYPIFSFCMLADSGIDSIEISGNGTSVRGVRAGVNEAYFLNFAAVLAEKVSVPVILVGGLRSIETMNNILRDTKIELLSLSRPLLCEPDFPNKLMEGKTKVSKCISCNACYASPSHRCVFREKNS